MVLLEQGDNLSPENRLSIQISKCVVPKLNSFQSRQLPTTERQLKGEEAEREESVSRLQGWSLIKHVPGQPGPKPREEQPELSIQ